MTTHRHKSIARICLMAVILAALTAGCHSQRTAVKSAADNGGTVAADEPTILFVAGKMAYDSVQAAYSLAIDKQQLFAGRLNLEGGAAESEPQGLNYLQADSEGTVLSCHAMDNPLVRTLEYFEDDHPAVKTVVLAEADMFLRIQLKEKARQIVFRNGKETIKTINIDRP